MSVDLLLGGGCRLVVSMLNVQGSATHMLSVHQRYMAAPAKNAAPRVVCVELHGRRAAWWQNAAGCVYQRHGALRSWAMGRGLVVRVGEVLTHTEICLMRARPTPSANSH